MPPPVDYYTREHSANPIEDQTISEYPLPGFLATDYSWHDEAVCNSVGGDLWYVDRGFSNKEQRKICDTCPVKAICLEWAMDHLESFGVWGGLSPRQRDALRKQREAASSEPQSA